MGYVKEDKDWTYYDSAPPGFSVYKGGYWKQRKEHTPWGCIIPAMAVIIALAILSWLFEVWMIANIFKWVFGL